MNAVHLLGRLCRDPELRTVGAKNTECCSFTLAVDRKFKNAAGEKQTDFISIVCWGQTAIFANRFFHKGSRMLVTGTIQTRNWDDTEGKKHSVTEVVADDIEFVDPKTGDYVPQSDADDGGFDI